MDNFASCISTSLQPREVSKVVIFWCKLNSHSSASGEYVCDASQTAPAFRGGWQMSLECVQRLNKLFNCLKRKLGEGWGWLASSKMKHIGAETQGAAPSTQCPALAASEGRLSLQLWNPASSPVWEKTSLGEGFQKMGSCVPLREAIALLIPWMGSS